MVRDECIKIGSSVKKSDFILKSVESHRFHMNEVIYFMFLKYNPDQQGYKKLEWPYQPI